jgi:calcineurin-like phosphoesterase family protein
MNETIIRNHNSRVKSNDVVFFLGDFCFKNSSGGKVGEGQPIKAEAYLSRLNGRFVFIRGNHDRNNSLKTIIENIKVRYGGTVFNLIHNPTFANFNYKINLCGHVHDKWQIKRFTNEEKTTDCINMSVEVWGYKPVSFEEVMSRYRKWLKENK